MTSSVQTSLTPITVSTSNGGGHFDYLRLLLSRERHKPAWKFLFPVRASLWGYCEIDS